MAVSSLHAIRQQLDMLAAQGVGAAPASMLETLLHACSQASVPQLATLARQLRQQLTDGESRQSAANTLVKMLHTLTQAEVLTATPALVECASLRKVAPEHSLYVAAELAEPPANATLEDLLKQPNSFVRNAQMTAYLRRANYDELLHAIEVIWCDYALLPTIRNGLAARPADACEAARVALDAENLVMQRIALAVCASLAPHDDYRRRALDLLHECRHAIEEPMAYWVAHARAALDGTLPAYRMAQQTFMNAHADRLRSLISGNKAERIRALKALGTTRNPCFTDAVITMFDDPQCVETALEVAVKIAAFAVIPRLITMLDGPNQQAAAHALYAFGERRGMEYWLERALRDPQAPGVDFTQHGTLLISPLVEAIRRLPHPEDHAAACRRLFEICRSQEFAERVGQQAERDPLLADQLARILAQAYPRESAAPQEKPMSRASSALQAVIAHALGPSPHTIAATLRTHSAFTAILPTPDGRQLLTLNARGAVHVWETASWNATTLFSPPDSHHAHRPHAIAMSPDGQYLVYADNARSVVSIWFLHHLAASPTIFQCGETAYGVGITADGQAVLIGGADSVSVREWGTWHQIAILEGHQHGVEIIQRIPGTSRILTGDREGTLHVWDQQSWTSLLTAQFNGLMAAAVACSPDGRLCVVSDTLNTYLPPRFRVWETNGWTETAQFSLSNRAPATCFGFTPDGRYLVVGSDDLIFLESGSWREALTLPTAAEDIRALAMLPDGRQLMAGSRAWNIDRTRLP